MPIPLTPMPGGGMFKLTFIVIPMLLCIPAIIPGGPAIPIPIPIPIPNPIPVARPPPDCSWMRRSKTESGAAPAPHAPPTIFSGLYSGSVVSDLTSSSNFALSLSEIESTVVAPLSFPPTPPSSFFSSNSAGLTGPTSTPASLSSSSSESLSSPLFSSASMLPPPSFSSSAFFTLTATRSPCLLGARGTTGTIAGSGNLFCLLASVNSCLTANCLSAYSIQSSSVKP
mmetsp:Transcript_19408/g.37961  ORF Transcript_19408/g.37961 Transcript_19408/m.37961 type:complete len:227 (+) Transcript_19408:1075-1755(+)